jgi:hypothetical protein
MSELQRLQAELSALLRQIEEHGAARPPGGTFANVVWYRGLCAMAEERTRLRKEIARRRRGEEPAQA